MLAAMAAAEPTNERRVATSQRASARLSDRHQNAEGQMPATNATGDERKYWGVIPMMSAPVLSDMTKRMEDIGFEGVTALHRSEERRVGKEGVSRCRLRWTPNHSKKKKIKSSKVKGR